MDEIFKERKGMLVFADSKLTQRERPQAFIDAERRRIETGTDSDGSARAAQGPLQMV